LESENSGQAYDSRADTEQNKPSLNTAAKAKIGATLKSYECEGRGYFAKECLKRLKREGNFRTQPSRKHPSGRAGLNPSIPHGDWRASSFFLSGQETASVYHTASLHLRHGRPTVRVKIRDVKKEFIVDSGSGVSLIKPGICRGQVRTCRTASFGVTGDELGITGEQGVQFCLENRNYRHTFFVCPLPTNTDGN